MARKITGLSGVPMSNASGGSTHEVSCRPLDGGGFLVRESTYGNGDYKSKEYYSATEPKCQPVASAGAVGDEGLSGAIAECKS